LTDQEEKLTNYYEYDVFGNIIKEIEEIPNVFRYAGEQFDQEQNQYYLRARYYNPTIGRFTQEDIYRGDGLNLYTYVANNPIMYIDPSGYKKCTDKKNNNGNNVYSDGFGHRDDNYYIGNFGVKNDLLGTMNIYLGSVELDIEPGLSFEKENFSIFGNVGGGIGVSSVDIEGQTNTYKIFKNLSVSGSGEVEILTADFSMKSGISKDFIGFKREAMVAAISGEYSITINIFNRSVTITRERYGGAFGTGWECSWTKENGFKIGGKAANLYGEGISVTIK
ncbi:RHS repeat-associated core domain-containing protein, partial [Defluviitalea phaphyphila]|uniref:RHS repeat-associated core domain-containing protein n=1 Tax=Defluviitalea phaphyphila TaxID=1473580 RepID=UPI0007317440